MKQPFLLFCLALLLLAPGISSAAAKPIVISPSQPGMVLGIEDSAVQNQSLDARIQLINELLRQIESLQAIMRIMATEPNYTFTDRDTDLRVKYASPSRVTFSRQEDEDVDVLGVVYDIALKNNSELPGLFVVTDVNSEFFLAFYDAGLKLGMQSVRAEFEENLPAGTDLEEVSTVLNINGVAFQKEAYDYNQTTILGLMTGRYTQGDSIHSVTMPFSNLIVLQEDMNMLSEEEVITLIYTMTKNVTEL